MSRELKKTVRTWEGWKTASEIAEIWNVTSRRVRQIIEKQDCSVAVIIKGDYPTFIYRRNK